MGDSIWIEVDNEDERDLCFEILKCYKKTTLTVPAVLTNVPEEVAEDEQLFFDFTMEELPENPMTAFHKAAAQHSVMVVAYARPELFFDLTGEKKQLEIQLWDQVKEHFTFIPFAAFLGSFINQKTKGPFEEILDELTAQEVPE